ncbi:MAG: aldo/keto reductase [Candidatus Marinimicrobia bacterium]|nr:aldo/keto reductase [Candidatus Neomarinimicrobiota bacterium]
MDYKYLGNSGLEVSEICFGAMSFTGNKGWTHIANLDQRHADKLVNIALDNGVNFFDTADIYSNGISEKMLGKALEGKRSKAIIATKCGFRMRPGPNGDGLSRRRIIEACEASLKRLKTDYVDLYQIHSYDFMTPLEESLKAFDRLVKDGKVRYIGCSNFSGWQLMKALALQKEHDWERFISLQSYYSLVGRDIEWELIPLCNDQELGIMTWSPLHGGFLTGKYSKEKEWPKNTRLDKLDDALPFDKNQGFKIIDKLTQMSQDKGVKIAQLALSYLLHKQGVTSLVIGARNKTQLKENIEASDIKLSPDELQALDDISDPYKPYPHWYFDIFRKERNQSFK